MHAPDSRQVYQAYVDALNMRAFHRMSEFVHDTVTVEGRTIARADYVTAVETLMAPLADFRWEVDELIADGDRLAARLTVSGTPTGPWLGTRPTGSAISTKEFAFYHFREGRIDTIHYLLDTSVLAHGSCGDAGPSQRPLPRPGTPGARLDASAVPPPVTPAVQALRSSER
ncbi:ester cyclase [Streptomyces violaceusniger]|uniref:Ester cyclase n=1 Tax=Streptomyces violaceusniger TaxID=68280 RepID=A0A4D4LCA3_STRVO|nr:hypothetical protein SVIO_068200 [Streptomyces violaceusniger]